jgi:hypothetical protein
MQPDRLKISSIRAGQSVFRSRGRSGICVASSLNSVHPIDLEEVGGDGPANRWLPWDKGTGLLLAGSASLAPLSCEWYFGS